MASKAYLELRERVAKSADPFSLFQECSNFIDGILLDGMSGVNSFFQAYCAYAFSMGVEYEAMDGAPMCVMLRSNEAGSNTKKGIDGTSFVIDPIATILCFESENDVLYCIGHEVKHLLFRHIIKYKDLCKEETTGVIVNLCIDVEVNESLEYEMSIRDSGTIPTSAFDIKAISRILGGIYSEDYLQKVYLKCKRTDSTSSLADVLYDIVDTRCKYVLGYSIDDILYRVQVAKSSFTEELFKTADTGASDIFSIKDPVEARRFCRELCNYLRRCKYKMIVVGGGFGTDSMVKNGGEGKEEGNSLDGKESSHSKGGGGSSDSDTDSTKGSGGATPLDRTETADVMLDNATLSALLDAIEELGEVYLSSVDPSRDSQKSRGTGSGGRCKVQLKTYKSSLPWQVMLKRYLFGLLSERVYTKKRLNRRQPDRLELSGTKRNPTLDLIVGFDESSSITSNEISYFFSEFAEICEQFKCNVHFYRFTYGVQSYEYLKARDVKRILSKIKRSGSYTRFSGGTAFQPVFDAIKENPKIKVSKSVLVMFTDGYGEGEVDFGQVRNRMWVVSRSCGGIDEKQEKHISCPESPKNIFPMVPTRC